jgi:ribosome-associated translation inhibitor RaiA
MSSREPSAGYISRFTVCENLEEAMANVVFKNLKVSPYTQQIIYDRFEQIQHKFPDLMDHNVRFRISVDNGPHQAGVDCYTAQVTISGNRYQGVTLSKSDTNVFVALSTLFDRLHEKLHRFSERRRTKMRRNVHKNEAFLTPSQSDEDDSFGFYDLESQSP